MNTKDIVFHHITSTNGKVNLQELTNEILRNKPNSKWDNSHWSFYKTQITSERGRYAHLFSDEVKRNLKSLPHYSIDRGSSTISKYERIRDYSQESRSNKWPVWNIPTDEEQVILAETLLPYIKMLAPEIVGLIAEENNKHLSVWTEQLTSLGIRADIYLWEGSPVTFPGIRRHVGTTETSAFRSNPKYASSDNALLLDDNSYPKELWSFALRNSRYGKKNPANYSLAHILDHKDYNTRNTDELIGFNKTEDKNLFAGLYTSCANTIYIPTSFLKPTDHNSSIRKLLIQIIDRYYGSVCNPLPHNLSFNLNNIEDQWRLDNFPKPAFVGNVANIKNFIAYRNNVINECITNFRQGGSLQKP
jgi:hypothetical protein